ncbi:MAG: glycosyltransferase family 4 protein, partial [Pseudomonadota bacterium]
LYAHFLHTPASVARYAAMIRGHGWGFSAHAKDIWTIPDWEKTEKIADSAFGVTCTGSGAEHLSGLDPSNKKITLVYHGLDLTRFPDPPGLRVPDGTLRLLSVGRLVEKKGYDVLLDALARLPEGLDWHFDHIGGGALSDDVLTQADALGLSARITWHGKQAQDAVIAALRRSDLFVLPSRIADDGDRDGLPNVLMEAASQRLAILSTAVSAIPEFIESGTHGLLVPPNDAGALTDAIATLGADWMLRQRFADAALDRLRTSFDAAPGIDILDRKLRLSLATSAATTHGESMRAGTRLNARY